MKREGATGAEIILAKKKKKCMHVLFLFFCTVYVHTVQHGSLFLRQRGTSTLSVPSVSSLTAPRAGKCSASLKSRLTGVPLLLSELCFPAKETGSAFCTGPDEKRKRSARKWLFDLLVELPSISTNWRCEVGTVFLRRCSSWRIIWQTE